MLLFEICGLPISSCCKFLLEKTQLIFTFASNLRLSVRLVNLRNDFCLEMTFYRLSIGQCPNLGPSKTTFHYFFWTDFCSTQTTFHLTLPNGIGLKSWTMLEKFGNLWYSRVLIIHDYQLVTITSSKKSLSFRSRLNFKLTMYASLFLAWLYREVDLLKAKRWLKV